MFRCFQSDRGTNILRNHSKVTYNTYDAQRSVTISYHLVKLRAAITRQLLSNFHNQKDEEKIEGATDAHPNPGSSEMIWSPALSAASSSLSCSPAVFMNHGAASGNGQGSLREQRTLARISKLFERDCVWALTQTMVSFSIEPLWMHLLCVCRVFPRSFLLGLTFHSPFLLHAIST